MNTKINYIVKTLISLVMGLSIVMATPIKSLAANSVDYYDDILRHHYSIKTTDRDRANDFIITFYMIAMQEQLHNEHTAYLVRTYGTYFNQPRDNETIMNWASEELKTKALTYAADNAIALYNESISKAGRRFEANQILMAADLMQRMSYKKIKNELYRSFYEQGQVIFLQKFRDAGLINGNPSSPEETSNMDALKSFRGNNTEFNAYAYYCRYPDLQVAIGANGDALLKHYNEFGKAEGRTAK